MFKISANTQESFSEMRFILPFDLNKNKESFLNHLFTPLSLKTPNKKTKSFDVMKSLVRAEFLTDGARPVLIINFDEKGWDRLAYMFLKDMAIEVKKDPKSMPRSLRSYANLMDKLTEEPTGNGNVDKTRKIVIDKAIENLTPGVRAEITSRVKEYNEK